jgi:peptidoglycan/xylan/chitin deacetylase (PgdA/CDA1 family)
VRQRTGGRRGTGWRWALLRFVPVLWLGLGLAVAPLAQAQVPVLEDPPWPHQALRPSAHPGEPVVDDTLGWRPAGRASMRASALALPPAPAVCPEPVPPAGGPASPGVQPGLPAPFLLPILMYHHIQQLAPDASATWRSLTVTPADFETQMAYLAGQGYHTITFAELLAYVTQGRPLPSSPIIISFDDAWADQYTVAYPVLRRHCLRGTFFVPTGWAGVLSKAMTWAQIEEMSAGGMEFGSHTVNHPLMAKTAPKEALWQLQESKAVLEKHLGRPVVAYAHPFGNYNAQTLELLSQAGYRVAVTIASGVMQDPARMLTLYRTSVTYGMSLQTFAAQLRPRR